MNTNTAINKKNSRKSLPKMRELKNTSNKLGGAASYGAASYGAASYGAASYGAVGSYSAAGGDDNRITIH
jgi:hypothetical protein